MAAGSTGTRGGGARDRGPGPFVTHRVQVLAEGGRLVASSRRHRKGLRPHRAADAETAERPPPAHAAAFLRLWAPRRLAWWIAVLFAIGSALFAWGGGAGAWPAAFPSGLRDAALLNQVFVVGAVFFTTAAWLQWLEALNGDVSEALRDGSPHRWRWAGWRPRNLGYLASAVQLVGTLLFNVDTLDALRTGLSWKGEDLLVWTPDMAGCVCFLVASGLALAEVSQGRVLFAPRSISSWVAVVNLLGSVAFQISALTAFVGPEPATAHDLFLTNAATAAGGVCFLAGSYLMIPELFDEEEGAGSRPPPGAVRRAPVS